LQRARAAPALTRAYRAAGAPRPRRTQLDPAQLPPIARDAAQVAALSRQLQARTPRMDAAAAANAGVRLLAREGVDADRLTRDLRTFELRTTCARAPAACTARAPHTAQCCAQTPCPRPVC
jgi:hypothetical protein